MNSLATVYLVTTILVVITTAQNNKTCHYNVSDPNAPVNASPKIRAFIENFKSVLPLLGDGTESCVAYYDTSALFQVLINADPSCESLQRINDFPVLQDIYENFPSNFTAVSSLVFLQFLYTVPDSTFVELCDNVDIKLRTCVNALVPKLLQSLVTDSNSGCCDEFKDSLEKDIFGYQDDDDITSYVNTLLDGIMNGICAKRTPGFNNTLNQTCGYTIVQQLLNPANVITTIPAALSVPNDALNACAAYEGQEFESAATTTQRTNEFLPKDKSISGCAIHLDSIATSLASLKFIQNFEDLYQIFDDDTCWDLPSQIGEELSPFLPTCIHLANGYSHLCNFTATSSKSDFIPASNDQDTIDDSITDGSKSDAKSLGTSVGLLFLCLFLFL